MEEPDLRILFLSSLPENEIKQIIERLKSQSFLPGQKVVEEGDFGDSIFIIISGEAKVVAHILGTEIELATLSVGDVFGEMAFLTGRPRTASVIAVDELRVMEFNRLILEEILEKYPEILKKLEDFYQSHLEDTISKVRTKIKNRALNIFSALFKEIILFLLFCRLCWFCLFFWLSLLFHLLCCCFLYYFLCSVLAVCCCVFYCYFVASLYICKCLVVN